MLNDLNVFNGFCEGPPSPSGDRIRVLVTDIDRDGFFGDELQTRNMLCFLRKWTAEDGNWIVTSDLPAVNLKERFHAWRLYPDGFVSENRYVYFYEQGEDQYFSASCWNHDINYFEQLLRKEEPSWFGELKSWAETNCEEFVITDHHARFEDIKIARQAQKWFSSWVSEKVSVVREGQSVKLELAAARPGSLIKILLKYLHLSPREVLCLTGASNKPEYQTEKHGYNTAVLQKVYPGGEKSNVN